MVEMGHPVGAPPAALTVMNATSAYLRRHQRATHGHGQQRGKPSAQANSVKRGAHTDPFARKAGTSRH